MQPCWEEETYFKTLEYITDPKLNTMCESYNKCIIELLYGNYYYHYYCFTFYFILQNNSTITMLTFMNVDGAFILAETRRKTSVLLFVDSRFINDSDEFG